MQSRRSFIQRTATFLGALALSGTTVFLTGCSNLANDLVTAFADILSILSAAGIVPGGALVTAALNAVLSEVQAFENAPAADKTSIGQDLSLAIQLAQARLQTWFQSLNLTGTLATVIESLVSVILSNLAGLLPTLPVPPSLPAEITEAGRRQKITYKPVPTISVTRSGLKQASLRFRMAFNDDLTSHGYQQVQF
jgi:hypothetical protein